jgi:hypothetical protein
VTIQTDSQYQITRNQLVKFKKAAILAKAELDAIHSEIEVLEGQLLEYDLKLANLFEREE